MLALGCCVPHGYLLGGRTSCSGWEHRGLGSLILPSPPVPSAIHPGDVLLLINSEAALLLWCIHTASNHGSRVLPFHLGFSGLEGCFQGIKPDMYPHRAEASAWHLSYMWLGTITKVVLAVWGHRISAWSHEVAGSLPSLGNCRIVGLLETLDVPIQSPHFTAVDKMTPRPNNFPKDTDNLLQTLD